MSKRFEKPKVMVRLGAHAQLDVDGELLVVPSRDGAGFVYDCNVKRKRLAFFRLADSIAKAAAEVRRRAGEEA